MNDDLDPLDELLSACLDGTADETGRAAIDNDPASADRLARLRSIVAAVGEIPPPDPAERDNAISAALAAFDEITTGTAPPGHAVPENNVATRPPVPLAGSAYRRRRPVPAWAGMAAAAALAVFGISALVTRDRGDESGRESTATAAGAAGQPAPKAAAETSARDAPPPPAAEARTGLSVIDGPATVDVPAPVDASDFTTPDLATLDELRAYALTVSGPDASRTSSALPLPATCAGRGVTGFGAGPVTWQDIPGQLVVVPGLAVPSRALVVDRTCAVLAEVDLP